VTQGSDIRAFPGEWMWLLSTNKHCKHILSEECER